MPLTMATKKLPVKPETRSVMLFVRVRPSEAEAFHAKAQAGGIPTSNWLRILGLRDVGLVK